MKRRGSTILEAALWLPFTFMLLFGMVEFAKITYTYYTLHKILYNLARFAGTQQGINFCDDADSVLTEAKNYALTGSLDGSTDPIRPQLTADMIQVRIERISTDTQELLVCDCSASGCDAAQGGLGPDYIVVSIPDGYLVQPLIPFMAVIDPIPLKPKVRVPFGGT